jgi:cytochrome c-type biogenesis protein CcmH
MFALLLAVTTALAAAQPGLPADLEREAKVLEGMLIAPCCFTQQVSVHQSPAAAEARRDIRARLAAGQTRQQILDAYVAQHGRHVLAEPPAEGFDRTLYVLPVVGLLGSAALLALIVRRFAAREARPEPAAVVPADRDANARLDDELRDLD